MGHLRDYVIYYCDRNPSGVSCLGNLGLFLFKSRWEYQIYRWKEK